MNKRAYYLSNTMHIQIFVFCEIFLKIFHIYTDHYCQNYNYKNKYS